MTRYFADIGRAPNGRWTCIVRANRESIRIPWIVFGVDESQQFPGRHSEFAARSSNFVKSPSNSVDVCDFAQPLLAQFLIGVRDFII